MLGRTLLPSPDAYMIIDRQRASANGFLLAPATPRNFAALAHLSAQLPVDTQGGGRQVPQHLAGPVHRRPRLKAGTYLPIFTLFDPSFTTGALGDRVGSVITQATRLEPSR